MTEKKFDLTTKEGFKKAIDFVKSDDLLLLVNPISWLIMKTFSPEKTTEKQLEAIKEIIKEGKNQNVKKMKIKVSHNSGIDIASSLKELPIKVKFGNEACSEIEIEYI
ncbi:hypothetical protein [Flavobacterium cellulosilyticum]|uniref:Uncharacterized protein n=1 Tax=Flavobacterium cellulosilyticum TaxID=2541731 RepID=A0A4R5CEC1_9FLAO|nr:hypothetical protein [Flavobacterium cellulosilyticum]TDD97319.1 hypothetical protein E0F76_08350 [Flavobacterium cellulosilyticum]